MRSYLAWQTSHSNIWGILSFYPTESKYSFAELTRELDRWQKWDIHTVQLNPLLRLCTIFMFNSSVVYMLKTIIPETTHIDGLLVASSFRSSFCYQQLGSATSGYHHTLTSALVPTPPILTVMPLKLSWLVLKPMENWGIFKIVTAGACQDGSKFKSSSMTGLHWVDDLPHTPYSSSSLVSTGASVTVTVKGVKWDICARPPALCVCPHPPFGWLTNFPDFFHHKCNNHWLNAITTGGPTAQEQHEPWTLMITTLGKFSSVQRRH